MTTVEKLVRSAYADVFKDEVVKTASATVNTEDVKKVSRGLLKVASQSYSPQAHDAVCEMMKIASTTLDGVLSFFESERSKVSSLEKVSEVRGIIDEMLERGMIDKSGVHEKTSELLKKDSHKLEIVKEAMCLVSDKSGYGSVDSNPDCIDDTKRSIFGNSI